MCICMLCVSVSVYVHVYVNVYVYVYMYMYKYMHMYMYGAALTSPPLPPNGLYQLYRVQVQKVLAESFGRKFWPKVLTEFWLLTFC